MELCIKDTTGEEKQTENVKLCDTSIEDTILLLSNTEENSKLCAKLRESLLQYKKTKSIALCRYKEYYTENFGRGIQLNRLVHRGVYNEKILNTLHEKGLPNDAIVKAMKYGLTSLDASQLKCFEDFHVFSDIIHNERPYLENLSDELITTLKSIGLNDHECCNIIINGLISEESNTLLQLVISGIDVPGILTWQEASAPISENCLRVVSKIGVEDSVLKFLKDYGINKKSQEIFEKLQYKEINKGEDSCACNLNTSSESTSEMEINSSTESVLDNNERKEFGQSQECLCPGHIAEKNRQEELTALRNDYLRQTVMVPLSRAVAKTLQHKPSDPLHYIAYQLLHWRYGYVRETEKIATQNFVANATIEMDAKFVKNQGKREHINKFSRT